MPYKPEAYDLSSREKIGRLLDELIDQLVGPDGAQSIHIPRKSEKLTRAGIFEIHRYRKACRAQEHPDADTYYMLVFSPRYDTIDDGLNLKKEWYILVRCRNTLIPDFVLEDAAGHAITTVK